MKSLKPIVGIASIATLFLTLTPAAYAASVTLRPSLDTAPQTVAASAQGLSCRTPHEDAALAGAVFEMPEIAAAMGDGGSSVVQIDLLPNGGLQHYQLRQSSGNSVLDDSALRTARMSQYRPETQNCVSISGSYLLFVDF